jgi:hypothetical protein
MSSTAPGQPPVPNEDFWLFDDTTVARLRYDEEGRFLRAEIVTERDAVTRTATCGTNSWIAPSRWSSTWPSHGRPEGS